MRLSCIFVRWYDVADHDDPDAHLEGSMRKLSWAKTRMLGKKTLVAWYDVIDIERVIKPVFIQAHPTQQDCFFYNRFV